MAVLPILNYPDPRLHTVAKPVIEVNDKVRALVKDMAQTMYEAPGIGLAATQVNVHQQIIVIDLSDERNQLQVFINPELIWTSEETKVWQEGCLSVPDFYDEVSRPSEVKVKALGLDGKPFEIHADGLMAVCIQHEMDHLKGKVFVEYLSSLKRMRIAGKLKKRIKAGVI
ncbi:peptide deformylase [Polynucleobacter sp. 30F-ANTBAC]|jgi:peptide deformylase|uniref:peptide deformylase n=1 Tax=Polynucleobacter sp. 30F-ANTBAC TaxID=2689095 RepID=UPI001C0B8315|nr:peptide deformylase [Polynucleobacter sp. 30F-ANTBAC]MBU3600029.1 peptide deformylase [Polynucleobacter sp. 30F-ANTBAC]